MKYVVPLLLASCAGCAVTNPPKPIETISFYAGPVGNAAATEPAIVESANTPPPPATMPTLAQVSRTPTSTAPVVTLGQYMSLGAVVAEVNGTPIYANRIVRAVRSPLAANARELDQRRFRAAASEIIGNQIVSAILNEVVYATAQRTLDQKEKDIADLMTTQWRNRQISEFGGSPELARRNSAEIARKNNLPDDLSFDELVMHQYRVFLTEVFKQRKIYPRIQVTVAEMRDYYNRHLQDQFTEPAQMRYRLIKIDPAKQKDRSEAIDKAELLRTRVTAGKEDFGKVASEINDDEELKANAGDRGWVQKSKQPNNVESEVWSRQPGDVTRVIADQGAYFIAKVEDRKPGQVMSFDTKEVQDRIFRFLFTTQHRALMEKAEESLAKSAVIRGWKREKDGRNHADPEMMAPALDMAMQMYPIWSVPTNATTDVR